MSQTSESIETGKPTQPRNFLWLFPGGCLGLFFIVGSLLVFFISLIFGQRENWLLAVAGYGLILLLAALGGSANRLLGWTFSALMFGFAYGAFFLGNCSSYNPDKVSVYAFDGKEQRLAISERFGFDFEPSDTLQVWSRAPVQMEFFIPPQQAYDDSLYRSDSFNDYMDIFSYSFAFSPALRTWAEEHGSNSAVVKIKKKIEKVPVLGGKAEVPALRYTFPATGIGREYKKLFGLNFAFNKAIDSVRITTHPDSLLGTLHARGGKVYDVYVIRYTLWAFGLALAIAGVFAGIMAFKTQGDEVYKLKGSTVSDADKGTKKTKEEPDEVVEAEELTEEEAREVMKTSNPAPGKLDSTKELHTVQDLLSQTVTEIEEAQNNPGKLTQIIRNKKTRFQDESWRKLVVSKLTKLETILAVKEVIIKDQELNRELGTGYLDDQIKIKEKENRLAELDANTAEWKKKARDHEKKDEEPIITPSKAKLKGEKIRERLEEEDAMREEIRDELDKLIDENGFREKRQKKWPDDEKNNSRLADIKNQIQKLEMKLKNL